MTADNPSEREFDLQDRINELEALLQESEIELVKLRKTVQAMDLAGGEAVRQRDNYATLVRTGMDRVSELEMAAVRVLDNWESGDLADAVYDLGQLIGYKPKGAR